MENVIPTPGTRLIFGCNNNLFLHFCSFTPDTELIQFLVFPFILLNASVYIIV